MRLSRLLYLVFVALSVTMPVRWWVVEPIYIASPSMEPKLPVGANVFMDRVTLRWRMPRRGEIIVFLSPEGENKDLVKRVIAVPGETVEMREKKVYVDGKELDEPYAVHRRPNDRLLGDDMASMSVPKDTVFVLGDNRDESNDSSVWKDPKTGEPLHFLPLKNVRGLVRGFY